MQHGAVHAHRAQQVWQASRRAMQACMRGAGRPQGAPALWGGLPPPALLPVLRRDASLRGWPEPNPTRLWLTFVTCRKGEGGTDSGGAGRQSQGSKAAGGAISSAAVLQITAGWRRQPLGRAGLG